MHTRRYITCFLPLLALAILILSLFRKEAGAQAGDAVEVPSVQSSRSLGIEKLRGIPARELTAEKPAVSLSELLTEDATDDELLAAAKERGVWMRELIQHDPQAALDEMLPLETYLTLSPEVREVIEQPYSTAASLAVVPHCESPDGRFDAFAWVGEEKMRVYFPRERRDILSKDWVSLSGIKLDGHAAAHADPVWKLDPSEATAAVELFEMEQDAGDSSGALVGGEWVHGSPNDLEKVTEALLKMEQLPNPTLMPVASLNQHGGFEVADLLRPVSKASASWSATDKKILFINLEFADGAGQEVESSRIEGILAECNTRTQEMSHGAMAFSNIVVSERMTLPGTRDSYRVGADIRYGDMHTEGVALAVDAGLVSSTNPSVWRNEFDIIGIVFSGVSGTTWAGRASLGGRYHWINGQGSFNTAIHEFGHNYGLQHASRWTETNSARIPPTPPTASELSTGNSRHSEYGDYYDHMGGVSIGEYSIFSKNRLHWLDDQKIADFTGDTQRVETVRIYAFDEPNADSRPLLGARVQMQTSETFWLSYRGNHSHAIFNNSTAHQGLNVLCQISGNRARLLDMTPGNTSFGDVMLRPGSTYTDPSGLVTIESIARGGVDNREWIDVRITTGVSGNTNPTLSLSVDEPNTEPQQELTFTATATDDEGDPLTYDWDFGDGRTVTDGPASLTHEYLLGGTYMVSVTVSDGNGGSAEEAVQITVTDPLMQMVTGTTGVTSAFVEVRYAKGRFFASSANQLYSSFDGLTWELVDLPADFGEVHGFHESDSGIVLTGRKLIDGAYRGQIWESADGLTWQTIDTAPGVGNFREVCEGNGIHAAVGNDGLIWSKPLGGAWQEQSIAGESRNFYGVSHDGTDFWGYGQNSLLLRSSDGVNWVAPGTSPSGSASLSLYDGGTTDAGYAVTGKTGAYGLTTDNGATWVGDLGVTGAMDALTQAPGRVVVFQTSTISGSKLTREILVSADGISWQQQNMPNPFLMNDAAYGSGRLVMIGNGGEIRASGFLNGENATPTSNITLPTTVQARTDVSPSGTASDADGDPLRYYWNSGQGWFDGGASPTFRFAQTGAQLVRLTVVDEEGGVLNQQFNVTVEDTALAFDAVSQGLSEDFTGTRCVGDQHYAISEGKLFTGNSLSSLAQQPSIDPFFPEALATNGTQVLLAGYTEDSSNAQTGALSFLGEPNAVPLQAQMTTASGDTFKAVAHGNGTWVAVGEGGRITTRVGSGNWQEATSEVTSELRAIDYGSGQFMAVGAGGVVLVSADGLSWTTKTAPSSGNLSDVAFCETGFCVGGTDVLAFTADGGDTWTTRTESDFSVRAIVSFQGVILVIAENSTVQQRLVSEDGETWSVETFDQFAEIAALHVADGQLFAVGSGGLLLETTPSDQPPGFPPLKVSRRPTEDEQGVIFTFERQPGEVYHVWRTDSLSEGFGSQRYAEFIGGSTGGTTIEWTDNDILPTSSFYRIERVRE